MAETNGFEAARAQVLSELAESLGAVQPQAVEALTDAILSAQQVFFVGVGRVLLSLSAFAKRLAHLGVRAHIVGEITEPAITPADLLIVGSGSGTTLFPLGIAKLAHAKGAKVVHIGSNPHSELSAIAAFMVRIPVRTKQYLPDEIDSRQPMTSLFEQSLLLLGDTVAMMIIARKQLDLASLWQYHANLE